jgi:hypothetical protein
MKIIYTRYMAIGIVILFNCAFTKAQTGLNNVVVERYYVSDADDAAGSVGSLPVGSVTYRIFLDMKPGYKFQTAYGSSTHTLYINTSTSFFNNEDRGSITPAYTKSQAKNNTVLLDSWLSAGAACVGNFGVLKSEDNGVSTVINADDILQNNDPVAGIPLTIQDGLLAGTPGTFTALGIDNELTVFDAISQAGNSFLTVNGAWSCLNGAVGPDNNNKVLIAQITTDGVMSFELNIQLGTPDGGTEQYVARNPVGLETKLDCLTFNSSVNTGIENPFEKGQGNSNIVSAFPNPTNGKFSLTIYLNGNSSDNHYTLYNAIGKVILMKNIENASGNYTDHVDLSNNPKGLYFIEVSIAGKKSTCKIMKN